MSRLKLKVPIAPVDDWPPTLKIFLGALLALNASFMWALLAFYLKKAFAHSDPISLSWWRLSSSALTLGVGLLIFKKRNFLSVGIFQNGLFLILSGIFLAANYVFFALGLKLSNPENAQLMIQAGPFLTIFWAFILKIERVQIFHLLSIILALKGFWLFYQDQVRLFLFQIQTLWRSNLWVLMAALAWSLWAILQKFNAQKKWLPPLTTNAWTWAISALTLWPWVDWKSLITLFQVNWGWLIFFTFNTLSAYLSYTLAFYLAPTVIVNLIVSLNPLIVLTLSQGPVTFQAWIGASLIVLGLATAFVGSWFFEKFSIKNLAFLILRS